MHGGNAGFGNGSWEGMERADAGLQEDGAEGEEVRSDDEARIPDQKERRLDDFWSMTLNRYVGFDESYNHEVFEVDILPFPRPASCEIIRRATYHIRRQQ